MTRDTSHETEGAGERRANIKHGMDKKSESAVLAAASLTQHAVHNMQLDLENEIITPTIPA